MTSQAIMFVIGALATWAATQCFPEAFGLAEKRKLLALNFLVEALKRAERTANQRAGNYERMLTKSQQISQDAIMKLAKAHRDNNTYRVAARNPRHWEDTARELKRRIDVFIQHKARVAKAYCEDVFRISHGQVDLGALVDPEKYLLENEDGTLITAGELLRRAECKQQDIDLQLVVDKNPTIEKHI